MGGGRPGQFDQGRRKFTSRVRVHEQSKLREAAVEQLPLQGMCGFVHVHIDAELVVLGGDEMGAARIQQPAGFRKPDGAHVTAGCVKVAAPTWSSR